LEVAEEAVEFFGVGEVNRDLAAPRTVHRSGR
jgi:hypothetical protein